MLNTNSIDYLIRMTNNWNVLRILCACLPLTSRLWASWLSNIFLLSAAAITVGMGIFFIKNDVFLTWVQFTQLMTKNFNFWQSSLFWQFNHKISVGWISRLPPPISTTSIGFRIFWHRYCNIKEIESYLWRKTCCEMWNLLLLSFISSHFSITLFFRIWRN